MNVLSKLLICKIFLNFKNLKNNYKIFINEYKLVTIAFIVSSFIYPFTAVCILYFSLPTSYSNIFLKILYVVLYLYIIFNAIRKRKLFINKLALPLLFFFILYSLRIIIDISFRDINFASGSHSYVYSYFFGATFLPCFMIITSVNFLNSKILYNFLYKILVITNVLLVWYIFNNGAESYIEMLSGRTGLNSDDDFGTAGVFINPIQISLSGAILSLIAFINLLFIGKSNIIKILLQLLFFIIGIYNLFIGASRGPLFGFILVMIFIIFYKFYQMKKNIKYYRNIIFLILILFTLNTLLSNFRKTNEIFLLNRIELFYENLFSNEKEDRNFIYDDAYNLIKKSPIIGSQYVTSGGGYPHNLLFEVPMALGIIGSIFFLWIIYNIVLKTKSLFLSDDISYQTFGLFCICFLVLFLGLTSGSIFVNPEIWVCISLLLSLPLHKNIK